MKKRALPVMLLFLCPAMPAQEPPVVDNFSAPRCVQIKKPVCMFGCTTDSTSWWDYIHVENSCPLAVNYAYRVLNGINLGITGQGRSSIGAKKKSYIALAGKFPKGAKPQVKILAACYSDVYRLVENGGKYECVEKNKRSATTGGSAAVRTDAKEAWEQGLAEEAAAEKEWRALGGGQTEDEIDYESLVSGGTNAESAWLTAQAEAEREFAELVQAEEREKEAKRLAAEQQRLEEQHAAEQEEREALERKIAEQERKKRAAEREVNKQCSEMENLASAGAGAATKRYTKRKLSALGGFGSLIGDVSGEAVIEISGCDNAKQMMRDIESALATAESDLDALANLSSALAGGSAGDISAGGFSSLDGGGGGRSFNPGDLRPLSAAGSHVEEISGGSGRIPPGSPAASQECSYLGKRITDFSSSLPGDLSLSHNFCSTAILIKMGIEYNQAGCTAASGATAAQVKQQLAQYQTQYKIAVEGYNEIVTDQARGECAIKMREYGYDM